MSFVKGIHHVCLKRSQIRKKESAGGFGSRC